MRLLSILFLLGLLSGCNMTEPTAPPMPEWRALFDGQTTAGWVNYNSDTIRDGWKVEDTENYIIVYNTSAQPLIRHIVKDLEDIREKYIELFPPSGPIEAVSTVRICSSSGAFALWFVVHLVVMYCTDVVRVHRAVFTNAM